MVYLKELVLVQHTFHDEEKLGPIHRLECL